MEVVLFSVLLASLVFVLIWFTRRLWTKYSDIADGVAGEAREIPALPERRTLLGGHVAWIKERIREHGGLGFAAHIVAHEKHRLPVFSVFFGPTGLAKRACVVTDYRLAKALVHNEAVCISSQISDVTRYMIGPSAMLSLEGEAWKNHRKLLKNSLRVQEYQVFCASSASDVSTRFLEATQQHLVSEAAGTSSSSTTSSSPTLQRVEVHKIAQELTRTVLCKTLLGLDVTQGSNPLDAILDRYLACFNRLAFKPSLTIWKVLHLNEALAYSSLCTDISKAMHDITQKEVQGNDLLSVLLRIEDDGYERLEVDGKRNGDRPERLSAPPPVISFSREEAIEEAMTMFCVGYNTISCTFTWVLHYLALDPSLQSLVHTEMNKVLGSALTVTPETYDSLTFTKMVVKEAMRLRPAAPLLARSVKKDVVVEGYQFKKGDHVLLSSYLIHRSPDYWEEPEKFNVTRWTANQSFTAETAAGFMPFGLGARECPGHHTAMRQLLAMLSVWVRKWRMYLAKKDLDEQVSFTYSPGQLFLHLEPRQATDE